MGLGLLGVCKLLGGLLGWGFGCLEFTGFFEAVGVGGKSPRRVLLSFLAGAGKHQGLGGSAPTQ